MLEAYTKGSLWKTAPRALIRSAGRLTTWQRRTLRTFTVKVHRKFQNGILRRGEGYKFRFRKLNAAYVRRKVNMGDARQQLVATEEYANNIQHKMHGDNQAATIEMAEGEHSKAKLRYSQLANYLENGTRFMQKLPHWRPMERRAKKEARIAFGRMPSGIISFR